MENEYIAILCSQRSFDEGPGLQANGTKSPYAIDGFRSLAGECTFEKGEIRAPKAAYSSEMFVASQKINNLRLQDHYGESRRLETCEKETLYMMLFSKKEVSFSDVRKKLGISDEITFMGIPVSSEKKTFITMKGTFSIAKILEIQRERLHEQDVQDLIDKIAEIITFYKSDDSRRTQLLTLGIHSDIAERLLELNASKVQHLSLKAIKKLNPYLIEGLTYDQACEKAGYDFKAEFTGEKLRLLKGVEVQKVINEITNPVVRRAVSQAVKVVNAIIMKYGSPQAINIELAREMSKDFSERKSLDDAMKKNAAQNLLIRNEIIENYKIRDPKGMDIIKYRLWKEQDRICVYSGAKIPAEDIFTGAYEVDHIQPYSRSFDDSFNNKVLVTAKENRDKGNRTPFEYFGNDITRFSQFENRVRMLYGRNKKGKQLLKKSVADETNGSFKNRNLVDTRYATTVVYNLLNQYLQFSAFSQPKKKKHVIAVNGSITAYMRKRWGLGQKDRTTDRHHAEDAVIVACVTDGNIHSISRYVKSRELRYTMDIPFVDEMTGEIFKQSDYSRDEWDAIFGKQIPLPWPGFKTELDVRMGADPARFLNNHRDIDKLIDYPEEIIKLIRPIFVSQMPNHKVSGSAHDDTIMSPKLRGKDSSVTDKQDMIIAKVPLNKLKLNKEGQIEGYYNPESDIILYQALRERLLAYSGNAENAFKEPFHKPKSDGSPGPLVHKVKIMKKMTSGVLLNNGRGIAANGDMIRIDIFCEDEKYYIVPIYAADTVKKKLPNKACVAHKSYDNWKEMKEENFCFSLYSRDLLHIKLAKGIKVDGIAGKQVLKDDLYCYYISTDVAASAINGKSHDSAFEFRGLGIQRAVIFEKCQVDMMGNITKIQKERRMPFNS